MYIIHVQSLPIILCCYIDELLRTKKLTIFHDFTNHPESFIRCNFFFFRIMEINLEVLCIIEKFRFSISDKNHCFLDRNHNCVRGG